MEKLLLILMACVGLLAACNSASVSVLEGSQSDDSDTSAFSEESEVDGADGDKESDGETTDAESEPEETDSDSESAESESAESESEETDSEEISVDPEALLLNGISLNAFSPHNIVLYWSTTATGAELIIERRRAGEEFAEVARRPGQKGRFLDLKLKPKTEYYYRIQLCRGDECGDRIALPAKMTPEQRIGDLNISVWPSEAVDTDHLILTNTGNINTEDRYTVGHLLAFDRYGTIWWEFDTYTLGQTSEVELLESGTLMAELGMLAYEIDLDGSFIWSQNYEQTMTTHHDIDELPDGRLLYLAFDQFTGSLNRTWLGDYVNIMNQDRTAVDWSWRAKDHISTGDYNTIDILDNILGLGQDWTHANALIFDAEHNDIFMNLRNLDRIYCIDYPSGDINYVIGKGGDFGEGLFEHAHDPHFTGEHQILIYDNGGYSRRYSRLVEFRYDPIAKTSEELWEYREDSWWGLGLGGVLPLENGNVLATDGYGGRIFEVTRDKEKIWQATFADGWQLYKSALVDPKMFTEW